MAMSPKKDMIHNWMISHAGEDFSTTQLAKDLGVSLPTLLAYIKDNPNSVHKRGHGLYCVATTNAVVTTTAVADLAAHVDPPIAAVIGGADLDDAPGPQFIKTVLIQNNNETSIADEPINLATTAVERPFEW